MKKNNNIQLQDMFEVQRLVDAFYKEFIKTKNPALLCDRLAQFNKKSTKFSIIPNGVQITIKK